MTPLDLKRCVLDAKLVVQGLAHCSQEFILIIQVRLDQMSGKGSLGRTHSPNMEVVNLANTGELAEVSLDFFGTHPTRNRIQREINRFAEQAPRAESDYDHYDKTHGGINPKPARNSYYESRDYHGSADCGVRCHVKKSAADIDVTFSVGRKHQSRNGVDSNTRCSDPHHDARCNRLGVAESGDCFPREDDDSDH